MLALIRRLSVTLLLAGPVHAPVFEIQGAAHTSPLQADSVETRGIVTAVTPAGFYLQDPDGDGDDATSDGVFVYTGAPATVEPGDDVALSGAVVEYRPGGVAGNLTVTEIHAGVVRILARDRALPVPVRIGAWGRMPPPRIIDDDALASFEPARDGLDFWESLEGMRVRVVDPVVVGPTSVFGDCWVIAGGTAPATSARGGVTAGGDDRHPERVRVDDARLPSGLPAFGVGARLGDVTGVVSYRFGSYEVLPATPLEVHEPAPAPDVTGLAGDAHHLTVATFNVHNLGPGDTDRLPRLGDVIVHALGSPDVVVLEEIEDDSGPVDDGVVDARATLAALVDAVTAAGGPCYDAREIAPLDGQDGGAPGSNIRVALAFNSARVRAVDRDAATVDVGTWPVASDSGVVLSRSPGRVDPGNGAWHDSRKPLAVEFLFGRRRVFVVACHFASKSGSSPDFGAVQPPVDAGSAQRRAQAGVVRDFVDAIVRLDPRARVVVAGDFNDDWFAGALSPLEASADLYDLAWSLPEPERYTYIYEGEGHAIDHVFVSTPMIRGARLDIVHVAAVFPSGISDHDPALARIPIDAADDAGGHEGPQPLRVYPNPSAGEMTIEFGAADGTPSWLDVFDVRGTRVRRLRVIAGAATRWDGRDGRGRRLPVGVYLIRARFVDRDVTRKVLRIAGSGR